MKRPIKRQGASVPLSRRPSWLPRLLAGIVALALVLLAAVGYTRWRVDTGEGLLVGSRSEAGATYTRFTTAFGSDPIVVVLEARRPTALYDERNLERLGALENDLARDPRVTTVIGPGTIAISGLQAINGQVQRVLEEYSAFIGDLALLQAQGAGEKDPTKLAKAFQQAASSASITLGTAVVAGAVQAEVARGSYAYKAGDRVLDTREQLAEQAAGLEWDQLIKKGSGLPASFATYLAGPGAKPNPDDAKRLFDIFAAGYGTCSDQIVSASRSLQIPLQQSCQDALWRILLDLRRCPTDKQSFCNPKPQWAAVLPRAPAGAGSLATISVRLTPAAAADANTVRDIRDRIERGFSGGVAALQPGDAYLTKLKQDSDSAHQRATPGQQITTAWDAVAALGSLQPTECGADTRKTADGKDSPCVQATRDQRLDFTIAGAPLLTQGAAGAVQSQLLLLLPLALVLMTVLLAVLFRVRGRLVPLLTAAAATALCIGVALAIGIHVTPAVLASVPVLLGLAVDYSVQLVARYSQERSRGIPPPVALQRVRRATVPATAVAAAATLAGLLALLLLTGFDGGFSTAIPLVSQFATVLCLGIVLAWLAACFVALPLVAWRDADPRTPSWAPARRPEPVRTTRPLALRLAGSVPVILIAGTLLSLAGWAVLPRLTVQTDVEKLVASRLTELQDINRVRALTGYANELDVLLEGDPVGPPGGTTPANVIWQCQVAAALRSGHSDQVAQVSSVADIFVANASTSAAGATSAAECAAPAPAPKPSPSPAAGSPQTPAGSGSAPPRPTSGSVPTATPQGARIDSAVRLSRAIPLVDAVTPGPGPTLTPGAAPTTSAGAASATSLPGPGASPSALPASPAAPSPTSQVPAAGAPQSSFLCGLRLSPQVSRSLVMSIPLDTTACPAVDRFTRIALEPDRTPIDPHQARIAVGVRSTVLADQAALVHDLDRNLAPPPGVTATPTGLAVLAVRAYDAITARPVLLNLFPLLAVALVLLLIRRRLSRALLPVLPTALAAGWSPLLTGAMHRILPGTLGDNLGTLNPLTVVLGALVIALATEFGVVLLSRFDEERANGSDPGEAASVALASVGGAIRISALTLGAGFAVLAVSGLLPGGIPLLADFGLAVVLDLALAVGAVFWVMLPVAIRLEPAVVASVAGPVRLRPRLALDTPTAAPEVAFPTWHDEQRGAPGQGRAPVPAKSGGALPGPQPSPRAAPRRPGVTGRRAPSTPEEPASPAPSPPASTPTRRPGVSGRGRAHPAIPDAAAPSDLAPNDGARSGGRRRRPPASVHRQQRASPDPPDPPPGDD